MSQMSSDLTVQPDLVKEVGTGPFRVRRPVHIDRLPSCNNACPAGENIKAWLAELQVGGDEAAAVAE